MQASLRRGRRIRQRVREHESSVRLEHITRSALADYKLDTGHRSKFQVVQVIAKTDVYFPRKHRET